MEDRRPRISNNIGFSVAASPPKTPTPSRSVMVFIKVSSRVTHLDNDDILNLIVTGTPCGNSDGALGIGFLLNAGIVTSGPGVIV